MVKTINMSQSYLIQNFNALATEAALHLGMTKMTAMNEAGCCYALALYDIQQSYISEAATQEFYSLYNLVTTQLTPSLVGDLVRRAKLTDDEKKKYYDAASSPPLYRDFIHQFPDGTKVNFEKLYQFMQTIGKLQVGFESKLSKGQQDGRKSQGKMEGIAGHYENNHAFTCKPEELVEMLKKVRLADNHSAVISTLGHAFNFRKTEDGHYIVYDANLQAEPQKLTSLQEVSEAIIEAVRKVEHFTQSGQVMLAIKGISFSDGSHYFEKAIQRYGQTLLFARPTSGLAKSCHDIIVSNRNADDHLQAIASDMYMLYSSEHEAGRANNMHEFIRKLPPALQEVAKESLDYFRRAAFSESVEGKGLIEYDFGEINSEQQTFLSRVNDNLQKYHEGELARTDLAENIIAQLNQYGDLSEFPNKIYQRLEKLKIDLSTFMEGELSDAILIHERTALNLNEHNRHGHSLASRLLKESANKITLQAIHEKAKATGETFVYDPNVFEDPSDRPADEFLKSGNVEAVAYWMENLDARPLFRDDSIQKIISCGNVEVVHYLLTHPHDQKYADLKLPEQIIKNNQVMELAITKRHMPLLISLLERGATLDAKTANTILMKASDENLMAIKNPYMADREVVQQEEREKGRVPSSMTQQEVDEKFAREYRTELREIEIARKMLDQIIEKGDEKSLNNLFNSAIAKGQLAVARRILMKDLGNSPESVERQKQLLVLAADKGDAETVKRLVQNNPSIVDAKDVKGMSALSKACAGNYEEIVYFLIEKGAQVKVDPSSPLFHAAKGGNAELCKLLLREGASINQKSSTERLSPIAGVMLSDLPLEKKKDLLNTLFNAGPNEARVSVTPEQRPLIYEALFAAAKLPNATFEDIEMLSKKFNVPLDKVPHLNEKCLAVHALEANNLTLARELLHNPGLREDELFSQGIELYNTTMKKIRDQEYILESWETKKTGKYDRGLHQELESFLVALVKDFKFPLDVTTKAGQTPLMLAAQHKLTKYIPLFIEEGAHVDKQDNAGNTALHFAANAGNLENIQIISAACSSNAAVVNKNDQLPMHCLAQVSTTPEAMQALLGNNNIDSPDKQGNTILHYAVEKDKSLLAVRAILVQGANPLQRNGKNPPESALEIVVRKRIEPMTDSQAGKNSPREYLGNVVAVLQATPAKVLEKDRPLLNKLKPHKRDLLEAYEMYLSHVKASCQTPEEKKAVIAEIDRTLRGENGIGRLLKTKIRLKEFKIDNAAMKRLKEYRSHLVEGTALSVEPPRGPRHR